MTNDFDKILDECIDRINGGESLEDFLADYPDYAERLEPLLRVMLQTKDTYSFVPSASTKMAARQRFIAAREKLVQRRREKQPLFSSLFARPMVWATVAILILIVVAGYFGFRPIFAPTTTPPEEESPIISQPPVPTPDPEGNFVFLISDDVNAIEDFTSVNVTISKIGILPGDDSEQWLEVDPEVAEVDLTQVKGDKTQQIWRGNVPEDIYTNIFILVTEVRGVLKETGEEVEIKLPSNKLHIPKSFTISADSVVSFTFDITVIEAGKSGQYILKPQIDQSGADSKPIQDKGKAKGKGKQQ